jgi:hypothetical protein
MTAAKLCTLAQSDETAPAVFSGSNSARMRLLTRRPRRHGSEPGGMEVCVFTSSISPVKTLGFTIRGVGFACRCIQRQPVMR